MQIVPVPAFDDNYIWMLVEGPHAVAVDPGDEEPVRDFLKRTERELRAILVTHHHDDHTGGVAELAAGREIPVYGPRLERIPALTHPVGEGDRVCLPALGMTLTVMDVPGHTRGHVAYYGAGCLFCGDTLFTCGCGRLFEGTPEQMAASLAKLRALPDDTLVYCAHEYTQDGIRFAKTVEPDNADLLQRETDTDRRRAHHEPTVPSTLALEKATNPFLRWDQSSVRAAAEKYSGRAQRDPAQMFATVRNWKDRFDKGVRA
jgi:hydroxyacylglutathione hydrolase